MNKSIMILGAAGNFGARIARGLAKVNVSLIIAGRTQKKLQLLKNKIQQEHSAISIKIAVFDINTEFSTQLNLLKPFLVINTCGPFQTADYTIASHCIALGIHYIDIADARDFVNGMHAKLDEAARQHHCLAVTGASTVPGLSSAVLEHYKNDFNSLDSLEFGISPGQKTDRGLATVQSILSYLGKPLLAYPGMGYKVYGWQDLHQQMYPEVGKRWMANCEIPDLDLLPQYYGLKSIRFSAGMESSVLHLAMWALSWLIRWGLPINLVAHAKTLLKLSHWFDRFGTDEGGMHMIFSGIGKNGQRKTVKWFIIAKKGDGPQIPAVPAIILAKKLVADQIKQTGALPCIGLVSLEEYLAELREFDIRVYSIN